MATPEHLLRIRPGMDVYNTYQNQYIGSVVKVWRQPHPVPSAAERGAAARETGSAPEDLAGTPELVHEEGAATSPVSRSGASTPRGAARLGEEMGPFPTIAVGNTGPIKQSSAHHYATGESSGAADVFCFAVRPGRINLGILSPSLYIPTSAVRSVSMERVILDVPGNEIPAWRRRPTAYTRLVVAEPVSATTGYDCMPSRGARDHVAYRGAAVEAEDCQPQTEEQVHGGGDDA